jgi:hypothetical protein
LGLEDPGEDIGRIYTLSPRLASIHERFRVLKIQGRPHIEGGPGKLSQMIFLCFYIPNFSEKSFVFVVRHVGLDIYGLFKHFIYRAFEFFLCKGKFYLISRFHAVTSLFVVVVVSVFVSVLVSVVVSDLASGFAWLEPLPFPDDPDDDL